MGREEIGHFAEPILFIAHLVTTYAEIIGIVFVPNDLPGGRGDSVKSCGQTEGKLITL